MRMILALMLAIVGITLGIPWAGAPIANNENNVMYIWDGKTFEVQQLNIGFASVSQTVNGADSVAVWFDVSTTTYDFWDVYVSALITADYVAGSEDNIAEFRWYDNATVPTRTAGDTLKWTGFNSGDTDFGTLYYTVETDSAGRANSKLITALIPGERYVAPIQFRCDETASASDSIGYFFEIITTDSCEVNLQLIAIPRT